MMFYSAYLKRETIIIIYSVCTAAEKIELQIPLHKTHLQQYTGPFHNLYTYLLSQLIRLWYLSHRRPAKVQASCASAQSRQSLRCSHM